MKKVLFFLLCLPSVIWSQNGPGSVLEIRKAKGEIVLDGLLDEADWQEADVADNWYLNYPVDDKAVNFQTEARLTFNDHFLYVSFVCHDDESPDMINSLRRDFEYDLNDNVGMVIGPYNDRLNGFFFVMTPKGVQMEGTVSNGGSGNDSWNIFWDNKWYSKVVRYPDKWIVEMAIPFNSFRYKSNLREWNIAFDRLDKKRNQKSSWIRTPIQFNTGAFAYSGQLRWVDPVPPAKTNISAIPYIAGNTAKDSEAEPDRKTSDFQAGFDAKVGVTPSINLDLTVNPDFSQVEVDRQVLNLTRFEYSFPERRQFFLENDDLFSTAGFPEARPIFSRRIGIAQDTNGILQRVPITFGARLSGSINEKWRLAVMDMQTKATPSLGLPAQNYAVASVQRNFGEQSSLSFIFVNKESLGVGDTDTSRFFHPSIFKEEVMDGKKTLMKNTYNRVLGADLEMLSADNKWYVSGYAAQSFDDFNKNANLTGGGFLRYSVRAFNIFGGSTYIGKNFNAEAGFVPGKGVYPGQINYFMGAEYRIYPKTESIVYMGPVLELRHTNTPAGTLTDKAYSLGYKINFLSSATLEFGYGYSFQHLTRDFSLIDPDKYTSFHEGEEYDWHAVGGSFQSNTRQIINFELGLVYGGFYNGTNLNISGQLNARYQPYGNISLAFDYNDIKLPDNYGKEKLFLIGPRIDLTLTDKIFLTTYYQYNNLQRNMNLNARFQWRYQPASDFFIVYTENYFPENFSSKNRALVFKATYWVNL